MANKQYTVVKDGEKLKDVKSLATAKKLADTESAAVFYDGKCVYEGTEELQDSDALNEAGKVTGTEKVPEVVKTVKYTLTALMNIRKRPSMSAEKVGTAKKGAEVDVVAVKDDWLCLADGTFILYEGGRFAEKS